MNEFIKTAIFAGIALVALVIAIFAQPSAESINEADAIGQPLFADFDPLSATTLEVVTFDEATGVTKPFKVKAEAAGWVIPSHQNYPADAEDQMKEASASLIGLKKLTIVTADKQDWIQYEVGNPEQAKQGDEGIGRLFRLTDGEGNTLAELIVGRSVPDQTGQHFVRLPDDDRVYISNIDPSRLSNKFADWIEKDLLKIEVRNLKRIVLDNHSIDEANRRIVPGENLELTNQSGDPQWTMKGLEDDWEVKEEVLNNMKSAIDDLKIVNVDRKPELLVENLRKGREFFENLRDPANESIWGMLNARGFFPVAVETSVGEPQLSIFSNEGQIFVGLSDGVEYVLRFGEITDNDDGASKAADAAKPADASTDPVKKGAGYSRYIYVVARVNKALIEKPDIQPLPEWKGEGPRPALPGDKPVEKPEINPVPNPETKPEDAKQDDAKKGDTKQGDDSKSNCAEDDESKADDAKAATDDKTADKADGKADGTTDGKADDKPVAKPVKQPVEKQDDTKVTKDAKGDAKDSKDDTKTDAKAPDANKLDEEGIKKIRAEIARRAWVEAVAQVQNENTQAQADFEQKIKDAQTRVDELNGRFAPWYFVIPDSEYQKIHLARKDIIQPNKAVITQREGEAFLKENKAKEGIKTTESGLQYEVITAGTGASPKPTDTVEVRYKGTLINGEVFDQSRGDGTTEFQVDGVIKGWTEALTLMKEGAKWKLFIPGDLAYGKDGSGEKIGPNEVLIFEVELVKIK